MPIISLPNAVQKVDENVMLCKVQRQGAFEDSKISVDFRSFIFTYIEMLEVESGSSRSQVRELTKAMV